MTLYACLCPYRRCVWRCPRVRSLVRDPVSSFLLCSDGRSSSCCCVWLLLARKQRFVGRQQSFLVVKSPPARPRFLTLVCLLSRVILCGAILDPCNQSGTIDRSSVCFRHRLGRVRAEPSTTARSFQPMQIQPGSCCFLARNGMLFVVGTFCSVSYTHLTLPTKRIV